MNEMRIFIGIKIEDCLERIIEVQDNLRRRDYYANYTRSGNIHLTLAFLGEKGNEEIKKLGETLDQINYNTFDITINKLTNLRDMVVLEVEKTAPLLELQNILRKKLFLAGFSLDKRKYYPHITLSRKTNLQIEEDLLMKECVQEIILFSSERRENVLTYRPLHIKKLYKNNQEEENKGEENEST